MLTLASDFGSPYPAAMRGVVARRCDARVVDVAHDLPRQDVRAAAFWLRFVLPEFPPAVHCAVVDPGVGTDRAAVALRAGDHVLVGPDNGSLLPPARALAEESGDGHDDWTPYEVLVEDPASSTFHGRDVFAPAAADVHAACFEGAGADGAPEPPLDGLADLDFLRPLETDEVVDLRLPEADIGEEADVGEQADVGEKRASGDADVARGEVLVVDDFGNAITDVPGSFLDGRAGETVTVNGTTAPVVRTFAEVDAGGRLVTVGSHGRVECDVNRSRGDEAFGLEPGDAVEFRF